MRTGKEVFEYRFRADILSGVAMLVPQVGPRGLAGRPFFLFLEVGS